jgi:uncharacterized protein (TIGR00369 family)
MTDNNLTDQLSAPLPGYTIYDPIDPFENHAGPFFWRHLDSSAHHFVLQAEAQHCNSHGILHGGLMMTMMDLAMAVASKENQDDQSVTVSMATEFTNAGHAGELIEATGELVRRANSLVFVRGQIHTGDRVLLNASAVYKPLRRR